MTNVARTAAVAAVWLLGAATLSAQDVAGHLLPGNIRLDSTAAVRIANIVSTVRGQGLPAEPIIAKVRLGLLRHAPDTLIVAAAAAVANRLTVARSALGPASTPEDIEAGADALGAGVTPDALRRIKAAADQHSIAVPIGVVAQLVVTGVAPTRAAMIVGDLIRRGAPAQRLVSLGNDVEADVRAGAHANESLGVRMKQLEAILPAHAGLPSATTTSGHGRGGT
jgi:hypothetical protein